MSVWNSDEKLLIFASLISPLKSFCLREYQAYDTVFHQQMKHFEVHCIFNPLLSVEIIWW